MPYSLEVLYSRVREKQTGGKQEDGKFTSGTSTEEPVAGVMVQVKECAGVTRIEDGLQQAIRVCYHGLMMRC